MANDNVLPASNWLLQVTQLSTQTSHSNFLGSSIFVLQYDTQWKSEVAETHLNELPKIEPLEWNVQHFWNQMTSLIIGITLTLCQAIPKCLTTEVANIGLQLWVHMKYTSFWVNKMIVIIITCMSVSIRTPVNLLSLTLSPSIHWGRYSQYPPFQMRNLGIKKLENWPPITYSVESTARICPQAVWSQSLKS